MAKRPENKISTAPSHEEVWRQFHKARRKIARAFRPYVAGHRAPVRKLRCEGFRISLHTFIVPIQLRGHLPSGEAFCFRCRHVTCSLSIAPKGKEPVTEPLWREEVSRWDWPDAGSLPAEEAEEVLRELLALYHKHFQVLDRLWEKADKGANPEEVEKLVNEEVHALRREKRQSLKT